MTTRQIIQISFPNVPVGIHVDIFLKLDDSLTLADSYTSYEEWISGKKSNLTGPCNVYIGSLSSYGDSTFEKKRIQKLPQHFYLNPFLSFDNMGLDLNSKDLINQIAIRTSYTTTNNVVLERPFIQHVDECGLLIKEVEVP